MLSSFPTIAKKYPNQDDYAITINKPIYSVVCTFDTDANFTICNCLNRFN
jgi:hypothetical protein